MSVVSGVQSNPFSGRHLLYFAMLLYLPFQSYLPNTSIGFGINLFNIFLLLLIFLSQGNNEYADDRNYRSFKLIILLFMGYTLISALLNCGDKGIYESIITWKRLYFIPIIFFITYKMLTTERQIKAAVAVMSFITFLSSVQILRNNVAHSDAHYRDGLRYGGMFGPGGENDLAAFMAINFFWFLFWSQETNQRSRKFLFLGMAGLAGLACLYCYSRGGYIALAAGLLYYGIRRYRVMLLAMILLFFTMSWWAPQPVRERLEMLTIDEKLDKDASAQLRLAIWEGGLAMVADNFLYGVGPYNFGANIRKYAELPDKSPTASHNMYLRMAAELGVPGFLLFVSILVVFIKTGYRLTKIAQGWQSTWATAYTASIIPVFIVNYFGDRFFREELTGYIWVSAAIALKLHALSIQQIAVNTVDSNLMTADIGTNLPKSTLMEHT